MIVIYVEQDVKIGKNLKIKKNPSIARVEKYVKNVEKAQDKVKCLGNRWCKPTFKTKVQEVILCICELLFEKSFC